MTTRELKSLIALELVKECMNTNNIIASINQYYMHKETEKIPMIIRSACKVFNISEGIIYSKNRKQDIVKARQLICYYVCINKIATEEELANILGQNHSTINHGKKVYRNAFETNDSYIINKYNEFIKHMSIVNK